MDKTPVPGGYVEGYERARTDFSVKLRQANEKWEKLEREFYLKNDELYLQLEQVTRERDEAATTLAAVNKESGRRLAGVLTENRLLYNTIMTGSPYESPEKDAKLYGKPIAELTAAEVERVRKMERVEAAARRVQREDWDCNTCPPAPYTYDGIGCSPDCAPECLRAALDEKAGDDAES